MEKILKRFGGDNQKHSTVNLNGKTYNSIENTYTCINLSRYPTAKIRKGSEQENSTVADSGCTLNSMAVSAHLKNVRLTTKIIN